MIYYDVFNSKYGAILVCADTEGIRQINFQDGKNFTPIESDWIHSREKLEAAVEQLKAYFAGEIQNFELPLAPRGTDFQQRVWKALRNIPFGETRTYQDIAIELGNPNTSRAVGLANSLNPIPIVIPCHRVIGKNGKLTGYSGGMKLKEKLLMHEGILAKSFSLNFNQ
ncbi:MAG: methylated-DNA--[protein]-cysteine S-methyltransferase [Marinifilaceae bacterium]|jgi:methylated-DNA-[protein]-cysteine S-methyltransferase